MKTAHVYVAGEPGSGRVKVGHTYNIRTRASSLGTRFTAPDLCIYFSRKVRGAPIAEYMAHRFLSRYELGYEWFSCSPIEAALAVNRAVESVMRHPPIIPISKRLTGCIEKDIAHWKRRISILEGELDEARDRLADTEIDLKFTSRIQDDDGDIKDAA